MAADSVVCVNCGYDRRCRGQLLQTVEPSRHMTTTRRKQPSAWTGYLISAAITVPVMVALSLITMIISGGSYHVIFMGLSMVMFFGLGDGINRKRRHRVAVDDDAPVLGASVAARAERPEGVPPAEGNAAGTWHNGRFVLPQDQMAEVVGNPEQYDNVIVVHEHSLAPTKQGSAGPQWYFLLAKGVAIFINRDGSQVWTVRPQGVRYVNRLVWEVQSVSGKVESVAFESARDLVPILAWKSKGWQDFMERVRRQKDYVMSPWMLVTWSVETGHNPSGWVPFPLPYRSVKEGLAKLCSSSNQLTQAIRGSSSKAPLKWAAGADPVAAGRILEKTRELLAGKAKKFLLGGLAFTALGITVAVLIMLLVTERDAWQMALVCGGGPVLLLGVPLTAGGLYFLRVAAQCAHGAERDIQ